MIGLWVAVGGGVGAVGRFALSGWVTSWSHAGFPWGTFAVNLLGSLLLGFISRALPPSAGRPELRAGLMTGLCGGFTTFSTFDFELITLLRGGSHLVAMAYAAASVATCLAGILLGIRLGTIEVERGERRSQRESVGG